MRARHDRGAVAIVLAIVTTMVLVPLAGLAVDLGVQRVARRDMQSLADVVALDLSRQLDGVTTATQWSTRTPSLQSLADASRDRNLTTAGSPPLVTPTLGVLASDGTFTALPDTSDAVPTAVRVVAGSSVGFGFMPGTGSVARSAIGIARSSACFELGSYAASISPASSSLFASLLGPLLGNSTLNLVGYNGLASTSLSLLDLVRADPLDVGTVDELLNLQNLTAGDIYLASAHVLRSQGKTAQADVFDAAAGSVVAPMTVDINQMFGLTTANDAALISKVNALDLLAGTAFLADGQNLVGIPNLQAGLSSVGVTNTSLSIIERPRWACNDDVAHTAQIKLTADVKTQLSNSPLVNTATAFLRLTDPATGQPNANVQLGLNVDVAGAHGKLTSTTCNPDVFKADVWSDLLTARLTGQVHIEGSITVAGNLLGLSSSLGVLPSVVDVPVKFDVSIGADASKPAATTPTPVSMSFPPSTYGDHASVGSGSATLPSVTVSEVPGSLQTGPLTVLGVPISTSVLDGLVSPVISTVLSGPLTNLVSPVFNPVVDKVNGILAPLMGGLGITVAGADFYPLATPSCQAPKLVG